MKIILLLLLAIMSFSYNGHAQSFKEKIAELKLLAKQKLNDRIDQRSNQAMDSAMDKTENAIGKKTKSKKKKKKSEPVESTAEPVQVEAIEDMTQQSQPTN
jgi:hypothetical protein